MRCAGRRVSIGLAAPVHLAGTDGGGTWSAPTYIAHMTLNDLVRSSQGLMVGDYSTADVIPSGPLAGNSISAFAVGLPDKTLNQPMFVAKGGMPITGGTVASQSASAEAIRAAKAGGVEQQNVPRR